MQYAANSGVHHRGQVALLSRMLGDAPGNFREATCSRIPRMNVIRQLRILNGP
jgi:hypothetical protein